MDATKPLYVLHPGIVHSRTDGQTHFIGASRLAELYGIGLNECVVYHSEDQLRAFKRTPVHLYPSYSGNYKLPEA